MWAMSRAEGVMDGQALGILLRKGHLCWWSEREAFWFWFVFGFCQPGNESGNMYFPPGLKVEETSVKQNWIYAASLDKGMWLGLWNGPGQFEKSTVPWGFILGYLCLYNCRKMRLKTPVIYYHLRAVGKGLYIKSLFLVLVGCLVQSVWDTRDHWCTGSLHAW